MMTDERFIRLLDCDLDEPLTLDAVAEAACAPAHLLARLVRLGVLDTVGGETDSPLLPTRSVLRLRRMARLRRDLRVNYAGAVVILDLVERLEQMDRELRQLRRGFVD